MSDEDEEFGAPYLTESEAIAAARVARGFTAPPHLRMNSFYGKYARLEVYEDAHNELAKMGGLGIAYVLALGARAVMRVI